MSTDAAPAKPLDFLRQIVVADVAAGTHGGRVPRNKNTRPSALDLHQPRKSHESL